MNDSLVFLEAPFPWTAAVLGRSGWIASMAFALILALLGKDQALRLGQPRTASLLLTFRGALLASDRD